MIELRMSSYLSSQEDRCVFCRQTDGIWCPTAKWHRRLMWLIVIITADIIRILWYPFATFKGSGIYTADCDKQDTSAITTWSNLERTLRRQTCVRVSVQLHNGGWCRTPLIERLALWLNQTRRLRTSCWHSSLVPSLLNETIIIETEWTGLVGNIVSQLRAFGEDLSLYCSLFSNDFEIKSRGNVLPVIKPSTCLISSSESGWSRESTFLAMKCINALIGSDVTDCSGNPANDKSDVGNFVEEILQARVNWPFQRLSLVYR